MFSHKQQINKNSPSSQALRFAVTYIGFLLVCLALGLILAVFAADRAEESLWSYHASQLDVDVSSADSDLSTLENYARQLSTDSTFVRLCHMEGLDTPGFVYTAYTVMNNLALRQYGLASLPAKAYVYLPRSGYMISSSQFTELDQFYRYYLAYPEHSQAQWLSQLTQHGQTRSCFPLAPFSSRSANVVLAYDVSIMPGQRAPAIVWYELDTAVIARRFLSAGAPGSVILIENKDGVRQMALSLDGAPEESLLAAMSSAACNARGMARTSQMQLIRRTGANGWVYTLALPLSLRTEALGSYTLVYALVFLLAILFGAALVAVLVRQSMRPLNRLTHELTRAQDDNAQMRHEMLAQRPVLRSSYLRKLLSGHVSSKEEFAYIMRFLGLDGDYRYFVLFCNAYRQDGVAGDAQQDAAIEDQLLRHLNAALPPQFYTMPAREYVVVVTYPSDMPDAESDLARRVDALHSALLENDGVWFFAGAGLPCTQPQRLWESYEQSRTAFRCTSRAHAFLPYASIQKDTDGWYYPIEISAKLRSFIITGNRQQVSEMFALIHRENIEERRLSAPLLAFLLSDLRNTLLKARFQIDQPYCGAQQPELNRLDQRLISAETFQELEENALALCAFFVKAAEPSDPIPEIQRYLQENFSDPSLCLGKLSGLFNISESYLSHLFKDRTGENFSAYLENLRMAEAQRRLTSGDCSLSTLYAELGYSNPTTWRRAFKKRFGMTPSEMMDKKP